MPDLIIQSGKNRGRKLVLPEAEIFIGRDEDCQIRLASNDISRHHCRLTCRADTILVRDLGSRNGTFVNNMLIDAEVALKPGDSLRVGPITLQVPLRGVASPTAGASSKKGKPPRPPSALDSASDDDIASWLSEESLHDDASSGETTIISRSDAAAAAQAAAAASAQPAAAATPAPVSSPAESSLKAAAARKKTQSVADEAAEIIRRHWDQVKQKNGN